MEEPISANSSEQLDVTFVMQAAQDMQAEIRKLIIGQDEIIEMIIVAILADGHVLLEGVPGIAKTLLSRMVAKTLSVDFSRIQFTPDLMPADILGTLIFNPKAGNFEFKQGPLFSNIILIDEINRAPAKTQASLFEVMQERQISVDVHTYPMSYPYFVMATQNPVEQEGTYKLPEAQLDRFIFRLIMDYPDLEEEKSILKRFVYQKDTDVLEQVNAVIDKDRMQAMRQIVDQVTVRDQVLDYIAKLVFQTRNHPDIFLGASPRASLAIMRTSKAIAAMAGRYFVIPEDIQRVVFHILNHRIILNSERELEGVDPQEVIQGIVAQVEIPR